MEVRHGASPLGGRARRAKPRSKCFSTPCRGRPQPRRTRRLMNDSKNTGTVLRLQAPTALTWGDYRLLVESVQEYAMFLLDATGHVVTWNHGAERIKGYKPEDIIGKHFSV